MIGDKHNNMPSTSSIFKYQINKSAGSQTKRSKESGGKAKSVSGEYSLHSGVLSELGRRMNRFT